MGSALALLAAVNDLGSIVAAYVVTAVVLGTYVLSLLARARRARLRAEAVAARRDRPAAASGSLGTPAPGS